MRRFRNTSSPSGGLGGRQEGNRTSRPAHSPGPESRSTRPRSRATTAPDRVRSDFPQAELDHYSTPSLSRVQSGPAGSGAYSSHNNSGGMLGYGNSPGTASAPTPGVPTTAATGSSENAGDDMVQAHRDAQNLKAEARRRQDVDIEYVAQMLDTCKKDQEKLQEKLNNALENADGIENLEELFAVNDELVSAIDAGKDVLTRTPKKSPPKKSKQKIIEGPTINLLVQNEDVFSLICMLRAPSEKKYGAALALMNFAKRNDQLRNEIFSSGGMQPFLTLFRGRSTAREPKVVAAMAVAYILPTFVLKSGDLSTAQTLKFLDCLRFLVTNQWVSIQRETITREDMYMAASTGANALWINNIRPLALIQQSASGAALPVPSPQRQASFLRRLRRNTGVEMNNEEEKFRELKEVTELVVTLIIHIIKVASQEGIKVDYDIVEQICDLDIARPLVVREGLLTTLVEWIRSKELSKMRPSASALRHLISIDDKYAAGWIHSQVVNEGVVTEIANLFEESVGNDVREAIAQILSELCQTPPTRAAVVEAKCTSSLVSLLYDFHNPSSEKMVFYAGSALLQLAAGGIRQPGKASSLISSSSHRRNFNIVDKNENVVNEIIEGWAHVPFVQIALEHQGRLRSVAVEALRVLSEDTSSVRQTRLQLCGADSAKAFGKTLKDSLADLIPLADTEHFGSEFRNPESSLYRSVKDVYEALRALGNILEPPSRKISKRAQAQGINPKEMLIQGCMDMVQSEGMDPLIWISSLPCSSTPLADISLTMPDREDLVTEACKSLANLSPLLLSDLASSSGSAKWAITVFESLDSLLGKANGDSGEFSSELGIDALKGIGALADFEPLKIRIVDQTLAKLLQLKSASGDTGDIANSANQVLLSLGFSEDEITVQAGNDPNFLVDWFCLQRAFAIQAMARDEIRGKITEMWQLPLRDSDVDSSMKLMRQKSSDNYSFGDEEIFSNFATDEDSHGFRETLLQQYNYVYKHELIHSESAFRRNHAVNRDQYTDSLLKSQVYPMNHTMIERDWVLSHRRRIESLKEGNTFCPAGYLAERLEDLLHGYFPCDLLRNDIIPIHDFCPELTFDFRALMMPQRRYFSFRREGQLLTRLCEKQSADIDSYDVHWTLGFTNSFFEGNFVESLVQSLYLCPMITGLSFATTLQFLAIGRDEEGKDDGESLLANLTGSLPPWVSYLTFDNVLSDTNMKALISVLDTMGKLSADSNFENNQTQGKFACISIRNSPHISRDAWSSFFKLLGKTGPSTRGPSSTPLASLKILDLSGNKLGDESSALILELVHEKESGCCVEKLDLSSNRIGRGANVVRVIRSYIEYYRYNQQVGGASTRYSWKSSLNTLSLAENDLFLGQAALEIMELLKNNALYLRYLDLSNNGLEGDSYQLIAGALSLNSSLCHLNLSGNKFSSPLVDYIFHHLTIAEVESHLSFLLLENNVPVLTRDQQVKLESFVRRTRKNVIERCVKGQHEAEDEVSELPERAFDDGGVDAGDNMITVLFSEPLVYKDQQDYLHPFAKLDFDMERELLWQCMKEASRDIELSFDTAHHSRLLATLTKRCSCLHYSGHGHPDFLPFENGVGGPNWLNVKEIKELIVRDGVAPFKFVFVSACHSGLAGETFASAGVPHVVCCQQESELKDTAALAFTRSFYLALAIGQTVKESFDQGCKAVRATPNLKDSEKEMEKFVLLPRDGNHNVPVFRARSIPQWPKQSGGGRGGHLKGRSSVSRNRRSLFASSRSQRSIMGAMKGTKASELSVRNMIQADPAPSAPNYFLGREIDLYYVLLALLELKKRLVTVCGEPGIGRSSLVCALCHYVNERASTMTQIQHIYFIRPKQRGRNVSCLKVMRQLMDKVEESGKSDLIDQDADLTLMLDTVCKSLKNEKALIVFDRVELLENSDEEFEEFQMVLQELLSNTKQVKILLTAKNSLGQSTSTGDIGGQVEHPHELGPLNFVNSVTLFANLCPHLYTPSERSFLQKKLVANNDYTDCLPNDPMDDFTRDVFAKIGDGIPSQITKAAATISQDDLDKLQH